MNIFASPRTYNIVKDMPQYMVWRCFTRGIYYYRPVYWGNSIGGAYVVDDFGNLVKAGG